MRARIVSSWLLLVTCGCIPFVAGGGGESERSDPYYSEWQRIEAIREFVDGWREQNGALPASLAELCSGSSERRSWLCQEGAERATRDRWGNEFRYEPLDGSYRIGTSGPDGIHGSDDDLSVHSADEMHRVRALSGCYRLQLPDTHGDTIQRLLILDTVRVRALRAEWRAFASVADAGSPRPKWHPWRSDSILVSWTAVASIVDLRLVAFGDSISGQVDSPTAVPTWWNRTVPFRIDGVRVDCRTLRE